MLLHFLLSAYVLITWLYSLKADSAPLAVANDEIYDYELSVLMMIKDESHSILEFIKHYIEEGVDHFFIFDDGSTDATLESITECVPPELVSVYTERDIHFTGMFASNFHNGSRQLETYARMYRDKGIRDRSKWVIIVDADEYMTSRSRPTATIKELLRSASLSQCDVVSVPWLLFTWGDHEHTPANTVRSTLFDRWSFDKRFAVAHDKEKKFHDIDEGTENKAIVRTSAVRRLHYVHEADFFDPDAAATATGTGTVCIPHEMKRMECSRKAIAGHFLQPDDAEATVRANARGTHGFYQLKGHHNFAPEYCPYTNRIVNATISSLRTNVHEADVPLMKLMTFHYRVQSAADFERLMDPNRLDGSYYREYRDKTHEVNRADIYDDFMEWVRRPARLRHPDFLRAQQIFSSCPARYYL